MSNNDLLIIGVRPEFFEKNEKWFSENEDRIKKLGRKEAWWRNHTLVIEKSVRRAPLALSRELEELGYARSHFPERQGEFAIRGGVLLIAPLNTRALFQIEFH